MVVRASRSAVDGRPREGLHQVARVGRKRRATRGHSASVASLRTRRRCAPPARAAPDARGEAPARWAAGNTISAAAGQLQRPPDRGGNGSAAARPRRPERSAAPNTGWYAGPFGDRAREPARQAPGRLRGGRGNVEETWRRTARKRWAMVTAPRSRQPTARSRPAQADPARLGWASAARTPHGSVPSQRVSLARRGGDHGLTQRHNGQGGSSAGRAHQQATPTKIPASLIRKPCHERAKSARDLEGGRPRRQGADRAATTSTSAPPGRPSAR